MTAAAARSLAETPRRRPHAVIAALGRVEARRLVRSPFLWVGVALTVTLVWSMWRSPEEGSGGGYAAVPVVVSPMAPLVAMAVAGSFHRERIALAPDTPVGEPARTSGRLLAAVVPLSLFGLATIIEAAWVWAIGGLPIGDLPNRTLHAHLSAPELLQNISIGVLAVATGAAAGRRLRNRATSTLLLFIGWFPFVQAWWAFQSPGRAPWSILLTQPVYIYLAPWGDPPQNIPPSWLVTQPGTVGDYWSRAFVSAHLALWHDLWLIGLAMLFLAIALPGRRLRLLLMLPGSLLAAVAIAMQYAIIP